MDKTGKLTLPQDWHAKLQKVFVSRRIDDAAMCSALRQGVDQHSYLADPHTAVALAAVWDVYGTSTGCLTTPPVAVIATASPCKFEVAVTKAAGEANWHSYATSASSPASARALLAHSEKPYGKFQSK